MDILGHEKKAVIESMIRLCLKKHQENDTDACLARLIKHARK